MQEKSKYDIRHELAVQRTILSNERTLLAYSRTSLTLFIPGVTFYHFIDSPLLKFTGLTFIPLGVIVFSYGVMRFIKKRQQIRDERKKLDIQ